MITILSTMMPPPTSDNYKAEFWNIFDYTVTLTLDLFIPKFDAFILAPKSVSLKS